MSDRIFWVDPTTHWKAYGTPSGSGMKDAQVDDADGSTRAYSKSFDSKQDFFKWARAQASRAM